MTPSQQNKVINKAHTALNKDGVVVLKFIYEDLEEILTNPLKKDIYENVRSLLQEKYYNGLYCNTFSRIGENTVLISTALYPYVYYDENEFLEYILSKLLELNPITVTYI